MTENYPLIGKLYYKIPLSLESPVIIGSGEIENSDLDVLKEPITNEPYIPATSIIGVFRSYINSYLKNDLKNKKEYKDNFNYLFGDDTIEFKNKKDKFKPQSALRCDDILLTNADVVIRDGVAIDPQKNIAIDESKYNYELVEFSGYFDLNLEISLRNHNKIDIEKVKEFLYTLINGINEEHIRLGAKTNKGFGKLNVDSEKIKVAELDFNEKTHVWQWITNNPEFIFLNKGQFKNYKASMNQFKIDAWFRVKNSMLVKSYSEKPGDPDAVHLTRKNGSEFVLPGTSIMGAIQHRARKILNTLEIKDRDTKMKKLFGDVDKKNKVAKKGRVIIEETVIDNVIAKIQTRIKIDRFTGGTTFGALFDMMPLWQNNEDKAINIKIILNKEEDWEQALLLFILKDLWTGDLAIGGEKNVGRGVLDGYCAEIKWDKEKVKLEAGDKGVLKCDQKDIEKLDVISSKLIAEK